MADKHEVTSMKLTACSAISVATIPIIRLGKVYIFTRLSKTDDTNKSIPNLNLKAVISILPLGLRYR